MTEESARQANLPSPSATCTDTFSMGRLSASVGKDRRPNPQPRQKSKGFIHQTLGPIEQAVEADFEDRRAAAAAIKSNLYSLGRCSDLAGSGARV
jgi:hypothetical protein